MISNAASGNTQNTQLASPHLDDIAAIAQALSDPQRLRALMALRDDELCVCHLIDLLELAPSTISKHLTILKSAGLIDRRKEGRWVYYSIAKGSKVPLHIRRALRWVCDGLNDDATIQADEETLVEVEGRELVEVCRCYQRNQEK